MAGARSPTADDFAAYGLPPLPVDPEDDVDPSQVAAAQVEMAENAMDIAGPIIERVNSRSFKWVEEAFAHADEYLDRLASGEGDTEDAKDDRDDSAEDGSGDGEDGAGADDGSDAAAADDDAGDSEDDEADEGEASRFPSRSTTDELWDQSDSEPWLVEAVLKRRRQKGVTMWLIKWKYVTSPSWELEEDLVEEGHLPLLEEFRAKAAAAAAAAAPERPLRKPKKSRPTVFDPCTFWPDFHKRVVRRFNDGNLMVTKILHCVPPSASAAFVKEWSSLRDEGVPVAPAMLFHGTDDRNWRSISQRGFFIPGTGGVRVVNGSAYGVGIYTGRNPGISCPYVRGQQSMFVCAGLIENKFATSVHRAGDMVIFFRKEQVVPCALVSYTYGRGQQEPGSYVVEELRHDRQFGQMTKTWSLGEVSSSLATAATFWKSTSQEAQARKIMKQTGGKLTKRQLKQLPGTAKEMFKNGQFEAPKSDRSKTK
eukprot:m.132840 g.132840  ORF g.132840 m.132840 type:complete len:481 (-) comp11343_c0_seq2:71-1513(-)